MIPPYEIYGNPLHDWLAAAVVLVVTLGVLLLARVVAHRRLKAVAASTTTRVDDAVVLVLERTRYLFLLVVAVFAASLALTLPPRVATGVRAALVIAFVTQAAMWAGTAIAYWAQHAAGGREDPNSRATMVALGVAARFLVWSIALLVVLANLGVNVTALITGLGITGVAVALAVQNILGDLFAALTIVIDKPFVVGDFIVLDDFKGTVQRIGLKSTRLRSVSGEGLVLSNSDLLKGRIRNYAGLVDRRVVFTLGVVYETPLEVVARIPQVMREIITAQPSTRFDRSHFSSYGDSALAIETVYWVTVPDYNVYMDVQQAILLEIGRRFAAEGIEFAFPSRRVYLSRVDGTDGAPGARSLHDLPAM